MSTSMNLIDRRVDGAETGLIAVALYRPQEAPQAFAEVAHDQFHSEALGAIWRAASALHDEHGSASMIALSVAGGLDPDALGRIKALRSSAATLSADAALKAFRYTHAIKDLHRLASSVCEQLAEVPADASGLDQVLVGWEYGTNEATDGIGSIEAPPSLADVLVSWGERVAAGEPATVATWGIPLLDERTGGLRPGSLHVPLANPGGGKSSLALTAALETATRGTRVLYVSLEMGREDFAKRVAAGYTGRTARQYERDLREHRISPGDLRAFVPPTLEDDHRSNTVPAIRAALRRARAEGQPFKLVVVDYIQLMEGPEENEAQRLERIAYGLATLAVEYECAIIAPAQPNRQSDGKEMPTMRQIKGSSGIESAADSVVSMRAFETLWNRYGHAIEWNNDKEEYVLKDANGALVSEAPKDALTPVYRDVECALVKARNGSLGSLNTMLRFGCGTFRIWQGAEPPWSQAAAAMREVQTNGSHTTIIE